MTQLASASCVGVVLELELDRARRALPRSSRPPVGPKSDNATGQVQGAGTSSFFWTVLVSFLRLHAKDERPTAWAEESHR